VNIDPILKCKYGSGLVAILYFSVGRVGSISWWIGLSGVKYKKGQLSLTNPRDACEKNSGVVSYIASLPIDSLPMAVASYIVTVCVCIMRRFGDTRLLKLPCP